MSLRRFLPGLVVLLVGCGPKPLPPQSPLDTAPLHYRRGLALLEERQLEAAEREFGRARALDPHFVGVSVGEALLAAARGDFDAARRQVDVALQRDNRYAPAWIAAGRVTMAAAAAREQDPEQWLGEATRAFRRAGELAPDDPEVPYRLGRAYEQALDLKQAEAALARAVEANRSPWTEQAMARLERLQQAERATPGTRVGLRLALKDTLTRAELTVLLVEELKLVQLVAQRRGGAAPGAFSAPGAAAPGASPVVATDLGSCWAAPWVRAALACGVTGLETYPDSTFRPEQPLTRADAAQALQGLLLLLTPDASLATRYQGEASRFTDLRADSYAYNAAALVTERGLMAADQQGRFRPQGPVAGAEVLLAVRLLQNAFRMEF